MRTVPETDLYLQIISDEPFETDLSRLRLFHPGTHSLTPYIFHTSYRNLTPFDSGDLSFTVRILVYRSFHRLNNVSSDENFEGYPS